MKKLAIGTALCLALPCLTPAAMADATVHIELADAGGNIDFSQKMDMGVGGHGDMSKAPVKMTADTASVPAGKVTFEVVNNSKSMQHEMVVAQLADGAATPPFKDADNEVDEDAAKALGEVAELDPGKSGTVTLDLKPGYYLLFCNVAGHYGAGMWTRIEVK